MDDIKQQALEAHRKLRGKIEVTLKDQLDKPEKLHTYYTPGVGAVSTYVAEHPEEAREYTWLNNNVAIISDGSAVRSTACHGRQMHVIQAICRDRRSSHCS